MLRLIVGFNRESITAHSAIRYGMVNINKDSPIYYEI